VVRTTQYAQTQPLSHREAGFGVLLSLLFQSQAATSRADRRCHLFPELRLVGKIRLGFRRQRRRGDMGDTGGEKARVSEPEGRDSDEQALPDPPKKSKQPPIKVKRTPRLKLRKARRLGR
jgi:hypothetical protein